MWIDTLMCNDYDSIVLKDPVVLATNDPLKAKNIPFTEYRYKMCNEIKGSIKQNTREEVLFFQFIHEIKTLITQKAIDKRKTDALRLQINLENEDLIVHFPAKRGKNRLKSKNESKKKK